MAFAVFVDVVIVLLLLYRQRQVRVVRRRVNLRLAGVLAVLGLIELIDFSNDHHLAGRVLAILVLSMLVGAGALGAIRAATVRIWANGDLVLRQGTWVTMSLWVVSLALHFGADWWIDALKGPSGLASASLLLYLGITYGVQNAVVHRRAEGLLAAAGPIDARSEPLSGRWWGGTWVGSAGGAASNPANRPGNSPANGPTGNPTGNPANGPWGPPGAGQPPSFPGTIDVPAEPLPPRPSEPPDRPDRPDRPDHPQGPPPEPGGR